MEELQALLDSMGKLVESVPTAGLWILLGFAVYKSVIYLSTAGSIVFLIRLTITKFHDYKTLPEPPKELKLGSLTLGEGTELRLISCLCAIRENSNYIHDSDVDWLSAAIREKKEREKKA